MLNKLFGQNNWVNVGDNEGKEVIKLLPQSKIVKVADIAGNVVSELYGHTRNCNPGGNAGRIAS